MDIEYLLLLQNFRNACGNVFSTFSVKASDFIALFEFVLFFFLYWSWEKKYGILCLLSIGTARFLNAIIKLWACVYRPWIRSALIHPAPGAPMTATGYSFPSGHTTTAAGGFGMLAWLLRKKKILMILSLAIVLLVMFIRNLLGVHTPQDVIGGCMTGAIAVFAVNWVIQRENDGKNRDWMIMGGCIVLVALALVYITLKSYPMDYDQNGKLLVDPMKMMKDGWKDAGMFLGIFIGWLIEKRYINFAIPVSWGVRISRFIPGILLYCLAAGKMVAGWSLRNPFVSLLGANWGNFIGEMLLYVIFIVIYPVIFCAVEKCFGKITYSPHTDFQDN